jgi:hypothetical protein
VNTFHRTQSHNKRRFQADCTAWIRTIAGHQDQPTWNADQIMVKVRTAYELLRNGVASDADFDRVGAALNIGLIRAESIDPLCEQTMQLGIDAMYQCAGLNERHGKYGFTEPGLLAMNDAVNLYEEVLRKSTPLQMQDAKESAHVRILKKMREAVQ